MFSAPPSAAGPAHTSPPGHWTTAVGALVVHGGTDGVRLAGSELRTKATIKKAGLGKDN